MKKIFLHNTLGKRKEEFKPIKKGFLWMRPTVRMYSCGPTVYNYAHIGNLRAYVFADILKRILKYNSYNVKHIVNVTDIGHLTSDADDGEDKMVKALKREGKSMTLSSMREVADFYFGKYKEDLAKLNILPADAYPFASDHIREDVDMIQKILKNGYAYKTSDGIYFDTGRLPDYGKLGGISTGSDESRIGINSEKKSSRDFALWKFSDESGIGFGASFGKGFPGWHIECSAMSEKYLSVPFDIHTGGIDHISVHHNNEIAQTEAAEGRLLANYWLHNAHLTIGEEKMAKSGENFLSLTFLEDNGISPLAYRYWLLTARYSTRIDFSLEALHSSQSAYERLVGIYKSLGKKVGNIDRNYNERFIEAINDDLDTPKSLALTWDMIKDSSINNADKKATLLSFNKIFGLDLSERLKIQIPEEVNTLLEKRSEARKSKDWAESDRLRKEIESRGYYIKDNQDGSQNLTK